MCHKVPKRFWEADKSILFQSSWLKILNQAPLLLVLRRAKQPETAKIITIIFCLAVCFVVGI